jgi:fatty-acid peroxygenase
MTTATLAAARPIPRLPGLDHFRALLRDPYRLVGRECARLGSDVVMLRLMGRTVLALSGSQAARLFYDKRFFTRAGAAPEPVRATLFGQGGVQTLEGASHLARKRFFLQAAEPERVVELMAHVERFWRYHAARWASGPQVCLYRAVQALLAEADCAWAGVPLPREYAAERTRQLVALFDQAASGLRGHFEARAARHQAEGWLADLIQHSRAGSSVLRAGSIACEAAQLRGDEGELLPPRVAAVELLNLLRPTVAVSVYVVQGAHALQAQPDWRAPLAAGDRGLTHAFVQEVRRFYPFFPAVAARTACDFQWHGFQFTAGTRTLLDLHGTNRDPRVWEAPDTFRPERFLGREPGPFDMVPQGGARAEDHHRCPGEGITSCVLGHLLQRLAASDYELPAQDLRIRYDRMPAIPASGFVMRSFDAQP